LFIFVILSSLSFFSYQFDPHFFFIATWFIFFFIFVWLMFFFNLVPHHFVSFSFYIRFGSHSFNYHLFLSIFSNWVFSLISSLIIWFWIIFMSNLISILLIAIYFVYSSFFNFIPWHFVVKNSTLLLFKVCLLWRWSQGHDKGPEFRILT